MDKMLYKLKTLLLFKLSMHFFLLVFQHLVAFVLISADLRAILNSISGVKYHFVVRFLIGHVYNKV